MDFQIMSAPTEKKSYKKVLWGMSWTPMLMKFVPNIDAPTCSLFPMLYLFRFKHPFNFYQYLSAGYEKDFTVGSYAAILDNNGLLELTKASVEHGYT